MLYIHTGAIIFRIYCLTRDILCRCCAAEKQQLHALIIVFLLFQLQRKRISRSLWELQAKNTKQNKTQE